MSTKDDIIKQLYPKFNFIEKDISKFKEIAFINGEEDLYNAQENIYKYISNIIEKGGLIKIFEEATASLSIETVFNIFELVIEVNDLDIKDDDIEALCNNTKYQKFYNKILKSVDKDNTDDLDISNELLKKVIEAKISFTEEINIEDIKLDDQEYLSDNIVKDYLIYIGKYNVLTKEQEQELFRRYRDGDEEAFEEIINHNLKLVVAIAKKCKPPELKMGFMDYIQEGNIGLMTAAKKFDPDRGTKFSTMAVWWIKQSLYRSVDNNNSTVRVPVYINELMRRYFKTKNKLESTTNREVSHEEIIKVMGLSDKKSKVLRDVMALMDPTSLDMTIDNGGKKNREKSIGSFIADTSTESIEEEVENNIVSEQYQKILNDTLTPKERYIIKHRVGYNLVEAETLETIGKKFGVTRERIRQIEAKANKKLREYGKKYKEDEIINDIIKGRNNEEMEKKSIYELIPANKPIVDELIESLTGKEKALIAKRKNGDELTKEETSKFFYIVRKLRTRIEEEKIKQNNDKKKGTPMKTIYELINVDRDKLNYIINNKLTDEERELILLRENIIKGSIKEKLSVRDTQKFYNILKRIRTIASGKELRQYTKKEKITPKELKKESEKKLEKVKENTPKNKKQPKSIYDLIDAEPEVIDKIVSELSEDHQQIIKDRANGKKLDKLEQYRFFYILKRIKKIAKEKTSNEPNKIEKTKEEIKVEPVKEIPKEKIEEIKKTVKEVAENRIFANSYKELLSYAIKDPRVIQEIDIMDISIACLRYGIGKSKEPRDVNIIAKFYNISVADVETISSRVLAKLYNIILDDVKGNSGKILIKTEEE